MVIYRITLYHFTVDEGLFSSLAAREPYHPEMVLGFQSWIPIGQLLLKICGSCRSKLDFPQKSGIFRSKSTSVREAPRFDGKSFIASFTASNLHTFFQLYFGTWKHTLL
jgi:hypothetical protein